MAPLATSTIPTGTSESAQYPGPPKSVFRLVSWSTGLWLLALLAAVVLAQSVASEWLARRPVDALTNVSWLKFAWLESRAAASIFIGLLALAVGRAQFALGLRPFLSYSNLHPSREDRQQGRKFFRVVVRNEGTGVAIVHKLRYVLRLLDGRKFDSILGHETLVKRLAEASQLVEGLDYKLDRFSPGATIGKDKERVVFELPTRLLEELEGVESLDIHFQYSGLLGDVYEKRIFCIPRPAYRRKS